MNGDGTAYFEDLPVGMKIRHKRGKTITDLEGVLITNLVVNTAQAHFNEHSMKSVHVGQRIVFGGVTASIVIGLASQDASENVVREVAMRRMRLPAPVLHGDTLYAFTEVTESAEISAEVGEVTFHHWGLNQRSQVVFEADRTVHVRRRNTDR